MSAWFRWAIYLVVVPACAQVDIGIQGGVPLNHFILDRTTGNRFGFSQVTSAPRRYTVGPYVAIPVRGPLQMEAGALYKRFGFDTEASSGGFFGPFTSMTSRTTGNSWEFPILAKLRLRVWPGQRGFVAAGPVIRHLTGIRESGVRTMRTTFPPPERSETSNIDTDSPPGMNRRTSIGVAVGGGLEFSAGPLQFQPGVRLTRWDTERTSDLSSASRLGRTQAEILLGVGYSPRSRERPAAGIPCCFEPGVLAGLEFFGRSRLEVMNSTTSTLETPRHFFTGGGLLDWRFHRRLSLEGSFIARRFGHNETNTFPGVTFGNSLSGYAWEAPLLLKWRAWKRLTIGTGPALRRASNLQWVTTNNGVRTKLDASWASRSAFGWAGSAGAEFRAGGARLRPELRYHWFNRPLYDFGSVVGRQDSLVLVLGISPIIGRPR